MRWHHARHKFMLNFYQFKVKWSLKAIANTRCLSISFSFPFHSITLVISSKRYCNKYNTTTTKSRNELKNVTFFKWIILLTMDYANACVRVRVHCTLWNILFALIMAMASISTDLTDTVERALACGHKRMESIQVYSCVELIWIKCTKLHDVCPPYYIRLH